MRASARPPATHTYHTCHTWKPTTLTQAQVSCPGEADAALQRVWNEMKKDRQAQVALQNTSEARDLLPQG